MIFLWKSSVGFILLFCTQWALIASRINSILGLALDFYSIQQTLSGGAVSAIKAKCEMEVDRIEKQFDDCIAFLLRVTFFCFLVLPLEVLSSRMSVSLGVFCAGPFFQAQRG